MKLATSTQPPKASQTDQPQGRASKAFGQFQYPTSPLRYMDDPMKYVDDAFRQWTQHDGATFADIAAKAMALGQEVGDASAW